ncbi:MAG: hypothetical protein WBO68_08035 [Pyrinomonadaceae bacterium]
MRTSISAESLERMTRPLRASMAVFDRRYPGESGRRQPVHTVYGGAHLFRSDTTVRLGHLAMRSFETYAPDVETFAKVFSLSPGFAAAIHDRVGEKLAREAVEDFRIDFEDGYGIRPDVEEDRHAIASAEAVSNGMAAGTLSQFFGIRIKPFSDEQLSRSLRTFDLFLTTLVEASGGKLPDNFVITLPKIVAPEQVGALIDVFDEIEPKLGLAAGSLKMEMMIETTQSIVAADGTLMMPKLVGAARGRCTAAHFGAFDYTASCSITAAYQDIRHPACDFARNMMQVSFAGTGVWLSDSVTNIMPVAPNRGENLSAEQIAENFSVVHGAWKLHYQNCRHSLANGFYQGWDLHPAQLTPRYTAVFAFFLEGLEAAAERLRNFVEKAAQATLVGDVFDDAATGQGLLNYFLRAINCGAVTEQEAIDRTSLTLDELRSGSFEMILKNRRL